MKLPSATVVDAALLRGWPLPDPRQTQSKEDRGRVFVVAGSPTVPGAAILAGEASLRAGAGKLQMAVPADVATAIAVAIPEAKVLPFPTDEDGHCRMTPAIEEAARSADAVLVGAGMDDSPALRRVVARLALISKSLVVDAGGIDAFQTLPKASAQTVMTPHEGEMASLLKIERDEVSARPAELALEFAAHAGVVVVLKGPHLDRDTGRATFSPFRRHYRAGNLRIRRCAGGCADGTDRARCPSRAGGGVGRPIARVGRRAPVPRFWMRGISCARVVSRDSGFDGFDLNSGAALQISA